MRDGFLNTRDNDSVKKETRDARKENKRLEITNASNNPDSILHVNPISNLVNNK